MIKPILAGTIATLMTLGGAWFALYVATFWI